MTKEVHATKLARGKGEAVAGVSPQDRAGIVESALGTLAGLSSVRLFNVCLDRKRLGRTRAETYAWDRLTARIETYCRKREQEEQMARALLAQRASDGLTPDDAEALTDRLNDYHPRAIIYADRGKEAKITKALRRSRHFNHIPSNRGAWEGGAPTKNIPNARIIEDPVFLDSRDSYFIQLADCAAYTLLRREASTPSRSDRYGIKSAWARHMPAICHRDASPSDPHGIVR